MGAIRISSLLAASAALALWGCTGMAPQSAGSASPPGHVTQARLLAADADADSWLAHGRTWAEQRFSPLADINDATRAS